MPGQGGFGIKLLLYIVINLVLSEPISINLRVETQAHARTQ